jgi:hypothetical protein
MFLDDVVLCLWLCLCYGLHQMQTQGEAVERDAHQRRRDITDDSCLCVAAKGWLQNSGELAVTVGDVSSAHRESHSIHSKVTEMTRDALPA